LLSLSENHPEFENKQLIREYAGYYLLDDFFEELYVHSSKELLAVHVCELHIYDICRRFINERVIYNTVTKIEVIDILDYIVTFDESYCVTYKSYEILCILKDK
jgi:hypothetical protein